MPKLSTDENGFFDTPPWNTVSYVEASIAPKSTVDLGTAFVTRSSKVESPLDTQVSGGYYSNMKIQPFEYSMANELDPIQHSIIKYVSRHDKKNGVDDLNKAIHCLEILKEMKYGKKV